MTKTTVSVKNNNWTFIDVKDMVLGNAASEIARKLMGKHKATYSTHINMGDNVVVLNAAQIQVTGTKAQTKVYKWHTGYPGGIKSEGYSDLLQRNPDKVIRLAVKGMLPKNKLRNERLKNLYIYEGTTHPHQAQEKVNAS